MDKTKKEEQAPAPAAEDSYTQQLVDSAYAIGRFTWEHKGALFFIFLVGAGGIAKQMQINRQQGATATTLGNPICPGFTMIKGQHGATRVAVAEDHSRPSLAQNCIRQLNSRKVLLEMVPSGETAPCTYQNLNVHSDAVCIGWDEIETINDVFTNIELPQFRQDFLDYVHERSGYLMYDDATLDAKFHRFLKNEIEEPLTELAEKHGFISPQKKKFSPEEKLFNQYYIRKQVSDEIIKLRKSGKSWKVIFTQYKENDALEKSLQKGTDMRKYTKEQVEEFQRRTEFMVKTLREHVKQEEDVTISAGAAHFLKLGAFKGGLGISSPLDSSIDYLYRELNKGRDRNPYAILVMDDILSDSEKQSGEKFRPRKNV